MTTGGSHIIDKLDIYDVIGALIPGSLVVFTIPILFPTAANLVGPVLPFPDAFKAVGLTAVSFFIGYTLQAVASILEPVLYWTWGGEMGSRALDSGLGNRYLPKELGNKIRRQLESRTAGSKELTSRSLFLMAMRLAEGSDSGRVQRFNAMYAYQRVLTIMALASLVLFIASFFDGLAAHLTGGQNTATIGLLALATLLFWHRAKQRGFYYVREVLLCAQRIVDHADNSAVTSKQEAVAHGKE